MQDVASAVPELDIRGILAELNQKEIEFLLIGSPSPAPAQSRSR